MASPSTDPPAGVPILPAATLMPVRDAPGRGGLEVCLLRRNHRSTWVAGLALFPGGAVDERDADPALIARCAFPPGAADDDRRAADFLAGGAAPWIAAIRETFEEIGLLVASTDDGTWAHDSVERVLRVATARRAVELGQRALADVLADEGLFLRLDLLRFVAHWVTPPGQSRRYDTRFYLAPVPASAPVDPDGTEIVAAGWVAPADAIAQHAAGDLPMLPPTLGALHWLAPHGSVDEAVRAADALGDIPRWTPGDLDEAARTADGTA
ncbi:MAG: NUDIX domain-containing protein [Patulibacter minatonensis]